MSTLPAAAAAAALLSVMAVSPSGANANETQIGDGSSRQISSFAGAGTADAADFAVTTSDDVVNGDTSSPEALLADPGPDGISLREAILAADNAGGHRTITFSPTLAGQTISPQHTFNLYQPGVVIQGLSTDAGQPAVTVTGAGDGDAFLFGVYTSDVAISGLRMTDVGAGAAISVDAGESFSPQLIDDVSIEGNVFDNTQAPTSSVNAIYLTMPSTATAAEINHVAVIGNSFDGLLNNSDGVLVAVGGTNDVIRDVEVEGNAFSNTTFPVEFVGADATGSRIEGARVVRNTFVNSLQPVNINQIGTDGRPTTTGNVIDGTLVSQNTFTDDRGPDVVILGGMTNATDNSITNTTIQDNLMTGSTEFGGVGIVGGRQESTGNSIAGVRLTNNTIVDNSGGGVGVQANLDGGTGNTVTGVTVLNSIVTDNTTDFDGLSASQVSFSLTGQPGYAGTNGNLDGDPAFVDPAGGDFHLQTGSPAIDAGSGDGASSSDLECRARAGLPDMGAFEYGGALATCPPPGTTIDAHPPSSTQQQSAAFSFESDLATSTFECKLDSGAFAPCTSPESYSGLTSGQHVFEVRAVDPDGDWDPDPAVFSWTITETTPPVGAPTISGFSPGSAGAHATVTVVGTGFTGATSVLLNGTSVAFGVTSNTHLTFTVPATATSGAITVVTPAGSATSTGSLTVAPPPTITAISPSSGPTGTHVTITGTNLQETVGVEIGHVVAVPTSIALDGTELTFTIPPGATTGAVRVLARNGSAASADVFTVTG